MLEFGLAVPRRIFYAGECIKFYFRSSEPFPAGRAFLRTNIGMAAVRRKEIINAVENNQRSAGRDWHDLELERTAGNCFELNIILTEPGIFELKPFFAPADNGEFQWGAGENLQLKVEAADNIGANLLYTAFVRQFGKNPAVDEKAVQQLDSANYTVIPPSGTFRDLMRKLDFIFGTLGMRILQLLPIHPVPTVYGRMGRYGSPFAALDYFAVDPALAEFDESVTPLEQFGELVDSVHARKGRIFLDIPVNHTGWASRLQTEHPEWFVRNPADNRIESPGAWGVIWDDLCKLDYSRNDVQRYMAEVFLYWCRKGVDGFRCDAGYMLPAEAWRYIEAKVRSEYPDTVFMLEGLGGPPDKQTLLLKECGLDWAYSELFQNFSRSDVENYSAHAAYISSTAGTLINIAETHDNDRLAALGETFAAMRCALMCFMCEAGTFGFTSGVEWFAKEKINVHGNSSLNWGAERNMVSFLQHLHGIMRLHPAFYAGAEKRWCNHADSQALAIYRENSGEAVLGLINLDWRNESPVKFPANMLPDNAAEFCDLLSGKSVAPAMADGGEYQVNLAPGECMLLSSGKYQQGLENELKTPFRTPELIRQQKLELALGKALLAAGIPLKGSIKEMIADKNIDWMNIFRNQAVVEFTDEVDTNRLVMVPPGWCLLIRSKYAFWAELKAGEKTLRFERSVRLSDHDYFALFAPLADDDMPDSDPVLAMTVFEAAIAVRRRSYIRYLPPENCRNLVKLHFSSHELESGAPRYALGMNDLGGYMQVPARWGELASKYDALLAANLNRDYPVDRRVLLVRCRVWLVLNGFSQEVNFAVQSCFRCGKRNLARWEFEVPVGQGKALKLDITGRFALNSNALQLEFRRRPAGKNSRWLADNSAVDLIVRCDIDNRCNHHVTRSSAGAEQAFAQAVKSAEAGFVFAPGKTELLAVNMPGCRFIREDEWQYMIDLPQEAYYGLESKCDIFSPGYFIGKLSGGAQYTLDGTVPVPDVVPEFPAFDRFPAGCDMVEMAESALQTFVVKRNEYRTVIAGYPWFLDWGRDTLIVLRGMIAANMLDAARDVILQFAGFEKYGTIPNMIRGNNDSNRDTSDAPLWLAAAVADYIKAAGSPEILSAAAGTVRRPVLEIIESVVHHYQCGTANGIFADKASNLIYSPAHFSWMDTNYPACSPRAGYPIEIQALWYAVQNMLALYNSDYKAGAEQTAASIKKYFYLPEYDRFCDCLHADANTAAADAVPDNALRPNALLAVTLGAVKEKSLQNCIVESSGKLIIPGAIRSLGNFQVIPPLPVKLYGRLLNNPDFPYMGRYCGPEDTSRKAAYHNGTAWCWLFPSYVEAFYMAYGDKVLDSARALLKSSLCYFNDGSPGQLPELADGDYPHNWGGCTAQAWSISEFYRVAKLLGL